MSTDVKIFRFKWFDEMSWKWYEAKVVAHSKCQAEKIMRENKEIVEIGYVPYQNIKVDSLTFLGEVGEEAGIIEFYPYSE